jgi:hypothetical protein
MRRNIFLSIVPIVLLCCCGCSQAPSVDILGSFFPAWMLCLTLGIFVAGLTRWQLVRTRQEKHITFPIIFYPGVVVAVACLLWLALFS